MVLTTASGATSRHWRLIVAALVVFALVRGAVWAFLIPPLNAPDEPSHLIAISQIRENRGLPIAFILDPGTVSTNSTPRSQAMLDYLASFRYTRFRALPYESTQPPLYYVTAAGLTYLLPGDPPALLYASRLVSVLFGAATVFCLAMASRLLSCGNLALAVGPPLALVLLPQFGFQSSTVTNDVAMVLLAAALCWAWAWAAQARRVLVWPVLLGVLLALGVLSKLTMLIAIPITLVILIWRARASRPAWGRFVLEGVLLAVPLGLLTVWWFLRNMQIYGEPTGARQMFGVIKGIYTTRLGLPPDTAIIFPDWGEFLVQSFFSFWGVFGWRGVYLPAFAYWLAFLLTILAVGGAIWWLVRHLRARRFPPGEITAPLLAYAALIIAAVASYLTYTLTTDASLQGRYIFSSLPALAFIGTAAVFHATPDPKINRILRLLALATMLLLQLLAWLYIGLNSSPLQ